MFVSSKASCVLAWQCCWLFERICPLLSKNTCNVVQQNNIIFILPLHHHTSFCRPIMHNFLLNEDTCMLVGQEHWHSCSTGILFIKKDTGVQLLCWASMHVLLPTANTCTYVKKNACILVYPDHIFLSDTNTRFLVNKNTCVLQQQ